MLAGTRVSSRGGARRVASAAAVLAGLAVPLIGAAGLGAAALPPACSSSHLSSFEYAQTRHTTKYVTVVYVNTADVVCTLRGYPDIVMFGASGPLGSTQRDVYPASNRTVVLPPNGEAGFVLWFLDAPVGGVDPPAGCARATNMHVTLATSGPADLTNQFPVSLPLCNGGSFKVTALQHGVPRP
jgi:Domain of unknown function (DUF4232)